MGASFARKRLRTQDLFAGAERCGPRRNFSVHPPFMRQGSMCRFSFGIRARGLFTVFDLWRKTMTPKLRSLARSGLLALGVIGGLSLPALGAPIGLANNPASETILNDGAQIASAM